MKLAVLALTAILGMALLLPAAFGAPAEIILDNASATFAGTWTLGSSSTDKYGADYKWAAVATGGGATATYTPSIPSTSGDWEVFAWYPQGSNRPTQAQYIIHTASGDTIRTLNQQTNGGRWNSLGVYTMNAGAGNYVRITNTGTETTKVVLADAIRFYSASGGAPDTTPPVISAVVSNPGYDYATITWTTDEGATSQVEYGPTSSYGSQTTKDTALVLSHSIYLSGLTPGTVYHYRVKSEDGSGNPAASVDFTFTTSSTPPPASFRGSWMDSWGDGFHNASDVSSAIDMLYQNNYNALIFEVRKRADACYESHYENKDTTIQAGFDPLADMITKAHAKNMEIHAWLVTYRIASTAETNAPPIYFQHKNDWLMKDTTGATASGGYYHFDPGVPGVQDYLCKIVMDIVNNYEVDGINFDYVRYPGNTWGYNEITKERFRQDYGYYPPTVSTDPNWGTWAEYRRQQVTDLMKKCYLEVMAVKPNVKMSVCGITWGAVGTYTDSSAYSGVLQDARKWMQDHIIDIGMPMNYQREHDATQATNYRGWSDFYVNNSNGRHAYIDQASYLNYTNNSLIQLQYSLDHGAPGVSTYDYWSTNISGQTKETFYNTVKTNLFTTKVGIPDMPWKSAPTTGIIFGTVTDAAKPNDPLYQNWVYKATVTATGPVTRSTTTDGTGTYGFLDLPTGQYTVSFNKANFSPITGISASVTAGLTTRLNVQLAAVLAPGSYKTLAEANDPALNDVTIGLNGNVVTTPTGTFPDCMYIETPGRSCGLQVIFDGETPSLTEGDSISLIGQITTIDDQRVLDHATLQGRSLGAVLHALGFSARDLGGVLPTTGLLVTALGNVTFAGTDYFYIDDGSALDDGLGHLGVKVLATGLTIPSTGFAKVTGISTCERIGGQLFQRLRVRKQADITAY